MFDFWNINNYNNYYWDNGNPFSQYFVMDFNNFSPPDFSYPSNFYNFDSIFNSYYYMPQFDFGNVSVWDNTNYIYPSDNFYNYNPYLFSYYENSGGFPSSDYNSQQNFSTNNSNYIADAKYSSSNYSTSTIKQDLGTSFIETAQKYSNCKESDNSHLKFCTNPGCNPFNSGEWCTDFVSYVAKETFKNKGMPVPYGFGNHDVETLKNWAINNGKFIRTSDIPRKGEYISQNIKPGDIFVLNENGSSHTGFVKSIDKETGTFTSIEGNRDDKVTSHNYSAYYADLSGFIRLS